MALALTDNGHCDYCGGWGEVCHRDLDEVYGLETTLCIECAAECDVCSRMFVEDRDGRSTFLGLSVCDECHDNGYQLDECPVCDTSTITGPDRREVCSDLCETKRDD